MRREMSRMNVYAGRHPVYVSHAKEVETLLYFVADLQTRLQDKGLDSGEQYNCLVRIRQKCRELLLRMYAEESNIMLLDDNDLRWIKLIVGFDREVIQQDERYAG